MATIFGSQLVLSQLPPKLYLSSSSQTPPPPPPQPQQSPTPTPQTQSPTPLSSPAQPIAAKAQEKARSATTPESTDWIASSLTRRFGLGAGLAWAGFLAFGVVSEQIKTRLEVSQQVANTKDVQEEKQVVLPNGIRYYEMKIGGGASPRPGDLVVLDLVGRVQGSDIVFVDTFGNKKPLALVLGSRPYTKGMCEGIEYVVRSMKAGGRRRVIVPPSLGFGDQGADLGPDVQIPPSSTLEFVVQVDKVSIAPT